MDEREFRSWLTQSSWALVVRYCKAVTWLLPLGAVGLDVPLLAAGDPASLERLHSLLAWQAAVMASCGAVLAIDRWAPRVRAREATLACVCALFMALVTWIGVRAILTGGNGVVLYAAGSTFLAAAIVTPTRVRRPLYALSLVPLVLASSSLPGSATSVSMPQVNLFCVVILCLALDRHTYASARALFEQTQRAQAECRRADDVLAQVLPAGVAQELKATGHVRARRFDNLGVLFADLAGFTQYANRLPPDALVLVLDRLFSAFDLLVQRHGAEKIKTIGDAYMVVCDGRIDALCRLALDLRRTLQEYNRANGTDLAMRIGLHAGPAVAGVLGRQRILYDVWGDTVNIASRLEAASHPGDIQVSEAVVRQAGDAFAFSARGLVDLPGRGRMLTWWLLDEEKVEPVGRALAAA